jgi:DNA-binding transcriptional MerR regulator
MLRSGIEEGRGNKTAIDECALPIFDVARHDVYGVARRSVALSSPTNQRLDRMADRETAPRTYAIGEVSDIVDQEPHVLRYWEQEFEVLRPEKDGSGRRVYTQDDIATIRRIHHLLKKEKYTIAGARQVLAQSDAEAKEREALRRDLTELRQFLHHLIDQLDATE